MNDWVSRMRYDPVKPLLESDREAIVYFTKRDLLEKEVAPIDVIWNLPEVRRILKKQQPGGSWKPGQRKMRRSPGADYALLETWRHLRYLIGQYGLDRRHPAIEKAAEYVFSCQTDEGDIRGMLANQYAPYYTGAIMSLLVKAGYESDPRIERSFQWLLNMRQDDGGWVIGSPGMVGLKDLTWREACDLTSNGARETARSFDFSKPFSAAGTGMVLRAFAAHPRCRSSEQAIAAAKLLKSKFFKKDNWSSYQHPDHWVRFQFPFWWTNLVSALDTLSLMGFPEEDGDVQNALKWLIDHQERSGLWRVSYSTIHKSPENERSHDMRLWITLAICRIFKRFHDGR